MNDRNTTPENAGGPPPPPMGGAPLRRSRRLVFSLAAMFAGLLPLLLLEGGLRLFDLGRPAGSPDPFAGFNRNFPLFEQQGAVYRTARSYAPFISSQEFPVEKPRHGFRIFCFGGSTVYGHPYTAETAFPKWLELELAGSDPTRAWQAINCGGVSYASYRIAPLVKEVLQHQADLIIVATGHNEFLEDRTYHALKSRSALWTWVQGRATSLRMVSLIRQWLEQRRAAAKRPDVSADAAIELGPTVSTRLDNASGYASYHRDREWHERVIAQYDESVRTIVAQCRAAHVPILLVRLGSNLRDCPPFKSEHRTGLAPEPEFDWQAAFDLATAAEKFDLKRALQYYQEAEKIDGEHALLSYRMARVLDRLGRKTDALKYFEKARDDDLCPLRIMAPHEQVLQRIAAATGTPLVDVAGVLAAKSPDGIPGSDWYVDHVHPTIGGHQWIARTLAAEMRERGLLARTALWSDAQRRAAYSRQIEELGPVYFADGQRRVEWLENWAQRQRLAAETVPNDAPGFARLGFRQLDLGQEPSAWAAIAEAVKRDSSVADLIRTRAQQLEAEGRPERAAALLRRLN